MTHPQVPEWAAPLTLQQYADFTGAVEDYFKNWDIPIRIEDGNVLPEHDFFGHRRFGLGNILQICAQAPNESYATIVYRHFDAMVSAYKFEKEFNASTADFERVREYLGSRLYARDYIGHVGDAAVYGQEIGSHVVEVLVFDLPQSVRNVQATTLEQWGKSRAELFALGRQNMRDKYTMNIQAVPVEGTDDRFWFVQSEHFFAPNILFNLSDYPHLVGRHGAIVGIPQRHVAFTYPIEDMGVVTMLHRLLPAAVGMYNDGPGAITPNLLWYSPAGKFYDITITQVDDRLSVSPAPGFVELLNRLATIANPERDN